MSEEPSDEQRDREEASSGDVSSEATASNASEETSAQDAPGESAEAGAPDAPEPVAAAEAASEGAQAASEGEAPSVDVSSEATASNASEETSTQDAIEKAETASAEAEVSAAAASEAPAARQPEEDLKPREKPVIPGADLIPDIVPEGDEFMDAEARAAAEAEAEEAARRASEADAEEEAQPIADAAIDLAAGARYTATGKRKTAVARVILKPGTGAYSINGRTLEEFFPRETLQRMIRQPLETVGYESRMDVVARMHGGGVSSQAGALRHGVSRALLVADPHLRAELKRRGFLTRDPRVKERKKAGLKKARKRPQFSKR